MTDTTMRERLEARRKRIAAGLPPPPPVTVTTAFLDGMGPVQPRQCVAPECGKVFTPTSTAQKTCGLRDCVRWNNENHKRENRKPSPSRRKAPLEARICAAEGCGREFIPKRYNHKTCGSERCKYVYKRMRQLEHHRTWEAKRKEMA